MFPELAELDAVNGLVVVHRALIQGNGPERQRKARQQDEDSRLGMADSGG